MIDKVTAIKPVNKRTAKSDLTKSKILNATLELIAQHGLSYLSHRLIAKQADVKLSLTSYYFGTLDKLIEAAFDVFDSQARINQKQVINQIEDTYLYCQENYAKENVIAEYIKQLTKIYADYFESGLKSRHMALCLENHFIHELNFGEDIANKVKAFNLRLHVMVEKLCIRLGSKQPNVDAYIIISTIRQVEFNHTYSTKEFDRTFFEELLFRMMRNMTK